MDHIRHVDGVVGDIAESLARSETLGHLWEVHGHATAGKSTVLYELTRRVGGALVPVLVSPSPGALDAGPIALAQVAAALKAGGVVNGESQSLADPTRPLSQKVDDVRRWLHTGRERVVLLCDEPMSWPATGHDDAHFARRTWGVMTALLDAPCRRVIAGRAPDGLQVYQVRDLGLESEPLTRLRDGAQWGLLADAAVQLARRPEAELKRYSPLQLRFLVALEQLGAPVSQPAADLTRRELSRRLAHELATKAELRPLREVWAKLALIRRPFDADMMDRLGAVGLGPLAHDLLNHCLLYCRGELFVLHETLRHDVEDRDWLDVPATKLAHRELAKAYAERFSRAPAQLVDQLEAYHHATASGDDSLFTTLKPTFVEQLDALGRSRSLAARRALPPERAQLYDGAVECFRQSIAWDGDNAYAHHYLAFNLDIQAHATEDVEKHYPKAIELEPQSPWFHSRWICYLVTRSEIRRAEGAWDGAIDALGPSTSRARHHVYEGLHRWVVRILLHRGHLAFAKRVLDHVPDHVIDSSLELRALRRRHRLLVEARDRRAFLPAPFLVPEWWKARPALLREHDGGALLRWIAARVEEVDLQSKLLHMTGGEVIASDPSEPMPKTIEVRFAEFNSWEPDEEAKTLSAGRFVEIGTYKTGKTTSVRARVHATRPWVDDDIPLLFPDPTRWIRHLNNH